MMKLGYFFAPAFVFALALAAQAQDRPVTFQQVDTVKVDVTGRINFDWIWRSAEVASLRGGVLATSAGAAEGWLGVRLDVQLTENVSAVLSARNQRLTSGATTTYGANPEATGMIVDEASISFHDAFTQGLTVSAGILPVVFDIRGNAGAMFFDPAHSQSMLATVSVPAVPPAPLAVILPGGGQDYLQPTGVEFKYSKDNLTAALDILPAIIEGGPSALDQAAYLAWFMYGLDSVGKGSNVGAIIALDTLAGPDFDIYTIGLGADIRELVEGLEVYAEVYFQFGDISTTVKQSGLAFQIGGKYALPNNDNGIWFGLGVIYYSGDDGTDATKAESFASYENREYLVIIEGQVFGIDTDTNYWAITGGIGGALSVGSGKNNLQLELRLGYAQLAETVTGGAGATAQDDLGFEVDALVTYLVNSQVSVGTLFGFVFGSDVIDQNQGLGDAAAGGALDDTAWVWAPVTITAKF